MNNNINPLLDDSNSVSSSLSSHSHTNSLSSSSSSYHNNNTNASVYTHFPTIILEVFLPNITSNNTNTMLTSSKIGNSKPKAFHVSSPLFTTPKLFRDVTKIPEWHATINSEYKALMQN